ncbi:NYN domain-containing protein [Helicobacter ganmani]|uniref:NYN domain-containing protein n=1 Tax=Helicobacter ganmani TaxID=60246 RepID=UPI003A86F97D
MGKKKVALFIDAENISANYAKFIFDNASVYGKVSIKRIYADWENGSTKQWKEAIAEYSIKAIQCPCFISKKNSSDMFLIADALEVLYETNIQTFIIVSSDSDYLPLVQKLKEKGKKILGFGMQNKAIKPYVHSFNKFIYFAPKQDESPKQEKPQQQEKPPKQNPMQDLINIIEKMIATEGKATYSQIGVEIKKKYPRFNPKKYDCANLRKLINNKFLSQSKEYEENEENSVFYLAKKNTKSKWQQFLLKFKAKA